MRFFITMVGSVLLLSIGFSPWAKEASKLNPRDASKVQALLCDPETVEQLKAIGASCSVEGFTIRSEDLNGDGKPEWLCFGPSGLCGAHGNCPVAILKKETGGGWDFLSPKACKTNDCLGWANDFATSVLPGTHNGYRDLLVGSDSGSFFWTKSVYQWDGGQYKMKPDSTTYYLADSDGKLVQVNRARWENCSRSGKNCL